MNLKSLRNKIGSTLRNLASRIDGKPIDLTNPFVTPPTEVFKKPVGYEAMLAQCVRMISRADIELSKFGEKLIEWEIDDLRERIAHDIAKSDAVEITSSTDEYTGNVTIKAKVGILVKEENSRNKSEREFPKT